MRRLVLGFALLLAGGCAGIYFSTRAALLEQLDNTLRAKASSVVSGIEQHGNRIEVELAEPLLREFDDGVPVDFFQLRRADGATVRRSTSLAAGNLPARFADSRQPKFWNLTLPSGHPGRAVGYGFASPVSDESETPAAPAELAIVFASDLEELNETLSALALVLLGCAALMLAATVVIVPRVLRQELAPLDQLAEQAARIDANSLSLRFPTAAMPAELAPISERLNHLLARLEESFERERRFSADLAHELRTPIAELRSLAEVALKWPDSRPAETDTDALAIALQMEGIVARLLELLRSERGQVIPQRETILLGQLVESVWRPFEEKIAQKRLAVTRDIPPKLEIQSDPVFLRSILANLVDNAVEYTPSGGAISVAAQASGGRFIIRILNDAEHVRSEDLPNFFDRFWRKDAARSDAKHCGLGLPLARAFAEMLGMELAASMDADARVVLAMQGPAMTNSAHNPGIMKM